MLLVVSGDVVVVVVGNDCLSVPSHRQTYDDGADKEGDGGAGNGPELIDAPILHTHEICLSVQ